MKTYTVAEAVGKLHPTYREAITKRLKKAIAINPKTLNLNKVFENLGKLVIRLDLLVKTKELIQIGLCSPMAKITDLESLISVSKQQIELYKKLYYAQEYQNEANKG